MPNQDIEVCFRTYSFHSTDLHRRELKVKFGDRDVMTLNQTTMCSIFVLLHQCMFIR